MSEVVVCESKGVGKMRRITWLGIGLVLTIVATIAVPWVVAHPHECTTYYNSRVWWYGNTSACGGTGGGCQECIDYQAQETCYEDQFGSHCEEFVDIQF